MASFIARLFGRREPAPPAGRRDLRLENGMRVILQSIPRATKVTVVVLHGVGNNHDPGGASGLAHLLEHIYFTGAAADIPSRSADDALRGGQANAQTGEDYTVFADGGGAADLDSLLRAAAARMNDLRITEADIARERPRLLDELENMFIRRPGLAAFNRARERARPTPRGGRRAGQPEHVAALTVADLQSSWENHYGAAATVLSVAGRLDLDRAEEAVHRHLDSVRTGKTPPDPTPPGDPVLEPDLYPAGSKSGSKGGYAAVAVSPPPPGSPDYAAMLFVAGRLVRSVPLKRRFSFPQPVSYSPLDAPEILVLTTALESGTWEAAAEDLRGRLNRAATDAPSDDEIAQTRREFEWAIGTQTPADAFAFNPYGLAFASGRRLQLGVPSQEGDVLREVSAAALTGLRERWLCPEKTGVAAVWPS